MAAPLRVLVLEDRVSDAELMLHELRRAGFEFDWQRVETEPDYLAHLTPELDVILADYSLPQFNALHALHRLQERGLDIPFIVVTATISEEVAVECMQQGAADYLLKDRLTRLGQAVSRALDQKRLRDEKRQADAALRESEERYRDLVEHSQDLICTHDLEGRILSVNLTATRALGYAADELLNRNLLDLMPPGSEDGFKAYLATIKEQGVASGLLKVLTRAGEARIWEYNNNLRQVEGEAPSVRGMARDVTDRWQAEKALRESEERYRSLFDGVPVGLYRTTAAGQFVDANPAMVEMLGYPNRETLASVNAADVYVDPEERRRWQAVVEQEEVARHFEVQKRRRDGTVIWVRDSARAVRDADGRVLYYEGYEEDITARKQAQEQVERLATKLKAIARPARQMSALLDLDELAQQVVLSLQEVTGCYNANLFLREEEDVMLVAGHGGYENGRPPLGHRLLLGQGIIGHVAQTGQPLLVPDVGQDPRYVAWEGLPHTRSELAVPVKHGDRLLGVVDMQATELNTFDAADLEALGVLADQLAVALENARLYEAEQKRAEQLAIINELGRALAATLDLPTLYRTACKYMQHLVDCPNFALSLFNPQEQVITAAFAISDDVELDLAQFPPLSYKPQARTGRSKAIASGQPVFVYDLPRALRESDQAHRIGSGQEPLSALYVPMVVEGQVIGLLEVQSYRHQAYSQEDAELLDAVANQIGLAIQNTRLFDKTQQRLAELSALFMVSSALRAATSRAEMLPVILDQLLNLLQAEGAAVAMRDPATNETVFELGRGDWATWTGQRLLPGEGVSGHVIAIGQPHVSDDLPNDPLLAQPDLTGGLKAAACVPLIAEEQTIGALWVGRRTAIPDDEVRLLTAVADIAANAIYRARLHEQTEQRLQSLTALRTIDMAITASLDLRVTLNVILDQVTSQLGVDAADILLLSPHTHTLEYTAGRGFRTQALRHTRLRLGEGHAGRAALERHAVSIPNLAETEDGLKRSALLPGEDFVAYYAVPLIAKGQVNGVLEIFHRTPLPPRPPARGGSEGGEWLDFLEAIAVQAAIAIDNAQLFDDLQRSNVELTLAYDTTLEGWARALEMRDRETEGHTRRVTEMTLRLARALGVSDAELVHVRRGAVLHDIGKIAVSDTILLKPGPLSGEEWVIMHQHPVHAYELLSPITYLRPALDIPYCHHEKWDGTGYPRGLKGETISLAARIFAVADVWDALRSDRPYRQAWPENMALAYVREQAGKHFDPRVVDAFMRDFSQSANDA